MKLKPVKEKRPPRPTLDDVVREYFDGYDRDIPALANSMGMTVVELYFALESSHLRGNVKGFAGKEAKDEINRLNERLIFGRNEVTLQFPENSTKLRFDHIDECVAYLWKVMGPESKLVALPFDEKRREVMVRFHDTLGNLVLGVVSELSLTQYDRLLEQYKGK